MKPTVSVPHKVNDVGDPYDAFDNDSDFSPGRDPGPGRAYLAGGVVGGLVGAAVVLLVWLTISALSPDSPGSADAPRPGGAGATVLGTQEASSGQCRQRFAAQGRVLRAADATLSQWEVHVGAMNKLVTGAISLQQATAFWNQTRVGAQERLARYDAAVRALEGAANRCSPAAAAAVDDQRCAAAVEARDLALRKAHRATATWRQHVHHMEMLRQGTLSPAMAQRMWLRSWHRGVRQLEAYRAAAQDARARHC